MNWPLDLLMRSLHIWAGLAAQMHDLEIRQGLLCGSG